MRWSQMQNLNEGKLNRLSERAVQELDQYGTSEEEYLEKKASIAKIKERYS